MWKWIKSKLKRKETGFTGFRVELWRDGKLMVTQRGGPEQILCFNTAVGCGPIIFKNGVRCWGYTLTPHLEGLARMEGGNIIDVDKFLQDN